MTQCVPPAAPAPDHDSTSGEECSLAVANVCTWQNQVRHPNTVRGRSYQLPDRRMHRHWVPVHNRHADTGSGVDCNSVVDAAHPLLQNLRAYSERRVCPTRGQCCLALDLRDGSRRWVRCWGSSPRKSFVAKLGTFLRRRLPQAWRPQSILNQLSQRVPQPRPARRDHWCRPHAQLAVRPRVAPRPRQTLA